MTNTAEQKQIQLDRMRFTKNTLGSRLVYLAILFNVFYFVSVYESDIGTWYYQALIGISIVYNLVACCPNTIWTLYYIVYAHCDINESQQNFHL